VARLELIYGREMRVDFVRPFPLIREQVWAQVDEYRSNGGADWNDI